MASNTHVLNLIVNAQTNVAEHLNKATQSLNDFITGEGKAKQATDGFSDAVDRQSDVLQRRAAIQRDIRGSARELTELDKEHTKTLKDLDRQHKETFNNAQLAVAKTVDQYNKNLSKLDELRNKQESVNKAERASIDQSIKNREIRLKSLQTQINNRLEELKNIERSRPDTQQAPQVQAIDERRDILRGRIADLRQRQIEIKEKILIDQKGRAEVEAFRVKAARHIDTVIDAKIDHPSFDRAIESLRALKLEAEKAGDTNFGKDLNQRFQNLFIEIDRTKQLLISKKLDINIDSNPVTRARDRLRLLHHEYTVGTREGDGLIEKMGRMMRAAGDLGAAVDRSQAKMSRLSAASRGIIILGALKFIEAFVSAVDALGGALVAVAGSAAMAGAAIGGSLVAGIAQALPAIGILVAVMQRLTIINQALTLVQNAKKQEAVNASKADDKAAESGGKLALTQDRIGDAIRGVTQARKDARRELEDLILAERKARLEAEGANLALEDSQRSLRQSIQQGDVGATVRDQLDVSRQKIGVDEAQLGRSRAIEDAGAAQSVGVKGSERVKDAIRALKEAREAAKAASASVEGLSSSTAIAGRQLEFLLGTLSSAERRLFRALRGLQEDFKKAFRPVTDIIINSLTGVVGRIDRLLGDPKIIGGFTRLARALAGSISEISKELLSRDNLRAWATILGEAAKNVKPLTEGFIIFSRILRDIAVAAGPALREILDFIVELLKKFEGITDQGERTRKGLSPLSEFFLDGVKHLKAWINLIGAILGLFAALTGAGGAESGLHLIRRLTSSIREFTKNLDKKAVREFFQDAVKGTLILLGILFNLGAALVEAFDVDSLQHFADVINKLVIPVLIMVVRFMGFIAELLSTAIDIPILGDIIKLGVAAAVLSSIVFSLGTAFGPFIIILSKTWAAIKILFLLIRAAPVLMGPWGIAIFAIITALIVLEAKFGIVHKAIHALVEFAKSAMPKLVDVFKDTVDFIKKVWENPIVRILTIPVRSVINVYKHVAEGIVTAFKDVLKSLIEFFKNPSWENLKHLLLSPFRGIGTIVKSIFAGIFESFKSAVDDILKFVKGVVDKLPDIGPLKGLKRAFGVDEESKRQEAEDRANEKIRKSEREGERRGAIRRADITDHPSAVKGGPEVVAWEDSFGNVFWLREGKVPTRKQAKTGGTPDKDPQSDKETKALRDKTKAAKEAGDEDERAGKKAKEHGQQAEDAGEKVQRSNKKLRDTRDAGKTASRGYVNAARSAGAAGSAIFTAMRLIASATNGILGEFGAKTIKFAVQNPGALLQGIADVFAEGGMIGGSGLFDTVPLMLGMAAPGEAIINRHQQDYVNHALMNTFDFDLEELFRRVRTPHYMAKGGTIPKFAEGGFTGPGHSGEGFTPVWNQAKRKFGMTYFTGFDGHSKYTSTNGISDHFYHRALDMGNGVLTRQEDALNTFWKEKLPRTVKQLIWRDKDQFNGYPIGGHKDHVHLALKDAYAFNAGLTARLINRASRGLSIDELLAESEATGGSVEHLKQLKIAGRNGKLKEIIQRASNRAVRAANNYIDKKSGDMVPDGGGTPTEPVPGIIGIARRAFKEAGVDFNGTIIRTLLGKESTGGKNYPPSGVLSATGPFQVIPGTFAANAAPGHKDISNPYDNALAAARYIKSAYGSLEAMAQKTGLFGNNYKGYAGGGFIGQHFRFGGSINAIEHGPKRRRKKRPDEPDHTSINAILGERESRPPPRRAPQYATPQAAKQGRITSPKRTPDDSPGSGFAALKRAAILKGRQLLAEAEGDSRHADIYGDKYSAAFKRLPREDRNRLAGRGDTLGLTVASAAKLLPDFIRDRISYRPSDYQDLAAITRDVVRVTGKTGPTIGEQIYGAIAEAGLFALPLPTPKFLAPTRTLAGIGRIFRGSSIAERARGVKIPRQFDDVSGLPRSPIEEIKFFHGTRSDFEGLPSIRDGYLEKAKADLGVYLTSAPNYARRYAAQVFDFIAPEERFAQSTGRLIPIGAKPVKTLEFRGGAARGREFIPIINELSKQIGQAEARLQRSGIRKGLASEENRITQTPRSSIPLLKRLASEKNILSSNQTIAMQRGLEAASQRLFEIQDTLRFGQLSQAGGQTFGHTPLRNILIGKGYDAVRKVDSGADTLVVLNEQIMRRLGPDIPSRLPSPKPTLIGGARSLIGAQGRQASRASQYAGQLGRRALSTAFSGQTPLGRLRSGIIPDEPFGVDALGRRVPRLYQPGQWGRGLFDSSGKMHTWNEQYGTYKQFLEQDAIGAKIKEGRSFAIRPDGKINISPAYYKRAQGLSTRAENRPIGAAEEARIKKLFKELTQPRLFARGGFLGRKPSMPSFFRGGFLGKVPRFQSGGTITAKQGKGLAGAFKDINPFDVSDLIEVINNVFDALRGVSKKGKDKVTRSYKNAANAIRLALTEITEDGGVIDQMKTAHDDLVTKSAAVLKKYSFGIKKVTDGTTKKFVAFKRLSDTDIIGEELNDLDNARQDLYGERGVLHDELRNAKLALKHAKTKKQKQTAQAAIKGITDRLQELSSEIADNIADRFAKQQELIDATVKEMEAATSRNDFEQRLAQISGPHFTQDFGATQTALQNRSGILQSQYSTLVGLIKQADAAGNRDAVLSLTQQLQDTHVAIVENNKALEENRNAMLSNTLALIEGQTQAVTGPLESLKGIINTISEIAGTGTDVNNLRKIITESIEQNSTALSKNLNVLLSSFGQDFTGLTGKDLVQALIDWVSTPAFTEWRNAMSTEQQGNLDKLIGSIIGNESAIQENTKALKDLNQSTIQSFSSASWRQFRQAVFDGMGNILPTFKPSISTVTPNITTSTLTSIPSTLQSLQSTAQSTSQTHINENVYITSPTEVLDPVWLSSRLAWERKTRK